MQHPPQREPELTRREFVHTAAVSGLALAGLPAWAGQTTGDNQPAASQPAGAGDPAELAIALVGCGSQGRNLLTKCLKIPGVRFVAICDIWPYHQRYAANILKKYSQTVEVFEDYQAMLSRVPSLDAVIIATPDWVHAEQTVACLEAGKHVYCEKEMSNTLDGARQMVAAAKRTGRLLQIGHQRRSNPRYSHALKLIEKDKVLGRITHVNGQWNRPRLYEVGWPKGEELSPETLAKYGYESMDQFTNWRWYKKFSGGAIADLGSHQIDVYNWFLKARPVAVTASGGLDYYKGREWYDNVMAIYEYALPAGKVRAFYQVLNTTSYGGFYEAFMGDEGSLVISEDSRKGLLFREATAKKREWEDESIKVEAMDRDAIELKIGETLTPTGQRTPEGERLLEEAKKDVHQLHLENFFDAVRSGGATPLNCPPEVGFETCATVLKVNEAVQAMCRVEFTPADFEL